MRIAVCLAGQPRSWKICYKNIRKVFEDPKVQVDYFIHTWSENGSDYRGYPHEVLNADTLEAQLIEAFKPKAIQIESYTELGLEKWYSHRHSICSSIRLKQTYELNNDFRYDWVFYSRLDFCRFSKVRYDRLAAILPEALENLKQEKHRLYGDTVHWSEDMSYHMQDYAWFGLSADMDLFSCIEEEFKVWMALHESNPEIFREYCAEDFFPTFMINHLIETRNADEYWDCGAPVRQCLEKFTIRLETESGLRLYGKILDRLGWYYTEEQLRPFFNRGKLL